MNCRRATIATAIAIAFPAWATEAAHEHAAASPLAPLVFSAINLLIFVWVIARFVMPQVRSWVRERRTRVVNALQEAAAAKAEAVRLQQEWETRLAHFNQSLEEMRAQARRDAEHERDRILAAARTTAEKIRRDAERAAASELRHTQELLRAELVRQAVRLAEDAARAQLTSADQQRFVDDFLKQVRR